jgi:hypothetical protein
VKPRLGQTSWSRALVRHGADAGWPWQGAGVAAEDIRAHAVGAICNHNLGVFTVTNIATENTDAVPPAHPVPRMQRRPIKGCKGVAGRERR